MTMEKHTPERIANLAWEDFQARQANRASENLRQCFEVSDFKDSVMATLRAETALPHPPGVTPKFLRDLYYLNILSPSAIVQLATDINKHLRAQPVSTPPERVTWCNQGSLGSSADATQALEGDADLEPLDEKLRRQIIDAFPQLCGFNAAPGGMSSNEKNRRDDPV